MKKSILSFVLFGVFISNNTSAQVIPNAGFETWNTITTYEEPASWGTLNAFAALGLGIPVTTVKTTDAKEGNYAALLQTLTYKAAFGTATDTLTGIATSSFKISSFYNYLTGYYKYSIPKGDSASAVIIVYSQGTAIGIGAQKFYGTESSYSLVNTPIYNFNLTSLPDSIHILFASSNHKTPGSMLYIDKLSLGTSPILGLDDTNSSTSIGVYPNPSAGQMVQFSNLPNDAKEILFTSSNGIHQYTLPVNTKSAQLPNSSLTNGMYVYEVKDGSGNNLARGKIILN